MSRKEAHYWDAVGGVWTTPRLPTLWRTHHDAVNLELFTRWLPEGRVWRLLKTDTFEEGIGDGLYSLLASKAEQVLGMDVSVSTLQAARARHTGLCAVGADARCLPFADDTFELIVSTSTLDHFRSRGELLTSLQELCRVLRPGGQLLLTLDNPANPVIALRNALPFALLHRLGIVPYYVGVTCGPRGLRRLLQQVGLQACEVTAALHFPRALVVVLTRLLAGRAGRETRGRFLPLLLAFERLSRWPTRFLTGHFVAVRAVKH